MLKQIQALGLLGALTLTIGCTGATEQVCPDPTPVAETSAPTSLVEQVPEIRPGIIQGYLESTAYPNSLTLLDAPPAAGTAAHAVDDAVSKAALPLKDTPRFKLAELDAHLGFPGAATTYSCTLGIPIDAERTPHLYQLLHRTLADAGLSSYAAKDHYQRQRPFVSNGAPICTPEEKEMLSTDGSYPSGHTTIGWAWALILTEIAPDKTDAILKRGFEYGRSRIVCNVHWNSDVQAGMIVGAAAVARLHADPKFSAMVEAAKAEYQAMSQAGEAPNGNCELEKAAFAN